MLFPVQRYIYICDFAVTDIYENVHYKSPSFAAGTRTLAGSCTVVRVSSDRAAGVQQKQSAVFFLCVACLRRAWFIVGEKGVVCRRQGSELKKHEADARGELWR